MKKKILFMIINMNVGGTEKALLNMISELPKEKFDITILMLEKFGGFIDFIPQHVKVEELKQYSKLKQILNQPLHKVALNFFSAGELVKAVIFIFLYFYTKMMDDRSLLFRYLLKNYPINNTEYDIAVAYAGPMDFISYFVVNMINAKKKIQWIHFDITKIGFNLKFAKKTYKMFDEIFAVSNEAKSKLIGHIPSLSTKTKVLLNSVSEKNLRIQAKKGKGFNDDFKGLRILTVGRLSDEKGQDLAILALAKLVKDGFDVRWYCIGDGNSRGKYEKLIVENNLTSKFILLGADTNPYTYFSQCDLYVQPSRYEGYCITIIEAMYFHKPIIATDVNGVREQIKDGETGFIVDIDERALYLAIKKLLNNQALRKKFSINLAKKNNNQTLVEFQ